MTDPGGCRIAEDDDVVHRYVAGTLTASESAEFELHLLGCGDCQSAARQGAALASALRRPRPARRASRRLVFALPLTAAAAAAALLLLGRPGDPVRRLGGVAEPPGFMGLPVRPVGDTATALVDAGMVAYQAGEYARAAALLGAAAAREPAPAVSFFLGAAHLFAGEPERAVPAFRAALDPPGNPYAAEANLYQAKAWLRLGRPDSALARLAGIASDGTPIGRHAAALADSVREAAK